MAAPEDRRVQFLCVPCNERSTNYYPPDATLTHKPCGTRMKPVMYAVEHVEDLGRAIRDAWHAQHSR